MNDYDEISLQDLLSTFYRNRYFIIAVSLVGLFLGLIAGVVQQQRSPVQYSYRAQVTMALANEEERGNQPEVFLHLTKSRDIVEAAKTHLRITSGEYRISTESSTKPGEFEVYSEGPNREHAIQLVNEVVARAQTLVNPAFTMGQNRIVQSGRVDSAPTVTSTPRNPALATVLGLILGGMISVFSVLGIIFLRGTVQQDSEIEKILKVPVLTTIQHGAPKSLLKKIMCVR